MKKNSKKKIFILVLFISFSGISTIYISNSLVNLFAINIHDTSRTYFKQLPYTSQDLAWNINGSEVCIESSIQEDVQICHDGVGGYFIAWHDWRNGVNEIDIYAQHINSNGILQWDVNGTPICNAENKQLSPQIISDGADGAIIMWYDWRDGIDYIDIYAQRVDSSGTTLWTHNGTAICTANNEQYNPEMCSDGAGGAIITWMDFRSGSNGDIYAQRIDSNGVVQWTGNGEEICTDVNDQYYPQICSDGAGGAIIAWVDHRNGIGNYDIYAQYINSDGEVQWTDNGVTICTATDYQEKIQVCRDGAGGAIIAWEDERDGNKDIYLQHIASNGVPQWLVDGVAICTADYDQQDLQIYSDRLGGAIIVWEDFRSPTNLNIYAQHINLNGTIQWTNNGKPICTASQNQYDPQLCGDGAGGAIFTWADRRSGSQNDIYAQRVDLNGNLKWLVDGIPICTADGEKYLPEITTEGGGTAIIVWLDNRDGNKDLYAQKLENPSPTSNHPSNIITSIGGTETINWTLSDDFGTGNYRVLANNTIGNNYIWVDWTSWANNTALNIPINRTAPGNFQYTIQYYDDQHNSGIPDTVIVQIPESEGGISGYSLIILISCSFGLILLIAKKLKRVKTN